MGADWQPVMVDASGWTDGQLRDLVDVYDGLARRPESPPHLQRWHRALAGALRETLSWRTYQYLALADDLRAALDPEAFDGA